MKAFGNIVLRYLPLALQIVPAVEASFAHEPGATKGSIALNAIKGLSAIAGAVVPEAHVGAVAQAIALAVDSLNTSGVFTHAKDAPAAPAPAAGK